MTDIVQRLRADGETVETLKAKGHWGSVTMLEQDDTIARLTAEVERLKESIEDAHQAASETQPSWKHRCYAIMGALGADYGDPDWMMPDEHRALTAEVERLRAALADVLSYVPHGDMPVTIYDNAHAALKEEKTDD